MRIAYLDCFAGISGDMFLGALLDAGLPPNVLHQAAAALNLGATLQIENVDRSGITSTKVHVLENGHLAQVQTHNHEHTHTEAHTHSHEQTHTHSHTEAHASGHTHASDPQHAHGQTHGPDQIHTHEQPHTHEHEIHSQEPETHSHEHEAHSHTHDHPHTHGRSLTDIRHLIGSSTLPDRVKTLALQAFNLLGASEAKIHNVPIDHIHFHEVGAVDAIVDIVAASAGIHALDQQAIAETGHPLHWHCSPLNVGGGMVECAHGTFPVPAPATADLLRGLPTYSAHLQKELVTPTGAALIRALAPTFGLQPAMRVDRIGYGAGTRNPRKFPNVLRLSLGVAEASTAAASAEDPHTEDVILLETALDDLSPQILAHVTEQALTLGALDVMTTAVGMKKGRPGTLLTILSDAAHSPALERLLLRETSTLGIRVHQQRRICLARHHTSVSTPFGEIRIKIGSFEDAPVNAAPEFEDCRAAARTHNVPVKEVLQAAIAAYVNLAPSITPDPRTPDPRTPDPKTPDPSTPELSTHSRLLITKPLPRQ